MKKTTLILASIFISGTAFSAQLIGPADFDRVIQDEMVVVEFFSPSCPHCKNMESVVAKTEAERPDTKFYKIDIKDKEFAQSKGITSWPTYQVYSKGQMLRETKGEMTIGKFSNKIDGRYSVKERIDELEAEAKKLMSDRKALIEQVVTIETRVHQIEGAVMELSSNADKVK